MSDTVKVKVWFEFPATASMVVDVPRKVEGSYRSPEDRAEAYVRAAIDAGQTFALNAVIEAKPQWAQKFGRLVIEAELVDAPLVEAAPAPPPPAPEAPRTPDEEVLF